MSIESLSLAAGDVSEAPAAVPALVVLVGGVGDVVVVGQLLPRVEHHRALRLLAGERDLVVHLRDVAVQRLQGRVLVVALVAKVVERLLVHLDLTLGRLRNNSRIYYVHRKVYFWTLLAFKLPDCWICGLKTPPSPRSFVDVI